MNQLNEARIGVFRSRRQYTKYRYQMSGILLPEQVRYSVSGFKPRSYVWARLHSTESRRYSSQ